MEIHPTLQIDLSSDFEYFLFTQSLNDLISDRVKLHQTPYGPYS